MDIHSFHIIAEELCRVLEGARVEKIHAPEKGVHVFSLFTHGLRLKLYLRNERKNPLLFFSRKKLENPPRPPAQVMRLRKYCAGRRLGAALIHPTERSMAVPVLAGIVANEDTPDVRPAEPVWLILHLVDGPMLAMDLPDGYEQAVTWPPGEAVDTLCREEGTQADKAGCQGGEQDALWQRYAVLSPLLRETLSFLDPLDGRALLVDLEAGGGGLFLYADKSGRPMFYAAWPLPDEVLKRRSLVPASLREAAFFAELGSSTPGDEGPGDSTLRFHNEFPALHASSLVDERILFSEYRKMVEKQEQLPAKKEAKRLARLLAKLDQEETRLSGMFAQREKAIQLQAVLWKYPADARLPRVELPDGGVIELDALLTVRDNMARMFHQSGRGKRGLAMLEQRRAELAESGIGPRKSPRFPSSEGGGKSGRSQSGSGGYTPSGAPPAGRKEFKDVAGFTSVDGFMILRGRNAKGNHSLLKIGKGHDLWLHVEEGPGAHVIIRRAHEGEQVPESTLLQAAGLAVEKSWQGEAGGGRVMVALLRHVHPMKGGGPGAVKVDSLLRTVAAPRKPD